MKRLLALLAIVSLTACTVESTADPAPNDNRQVADNVDNQRGCQVIDAGNVSTLIPDDWNEWCIGAENFAQLVADTFTDNDIRALCDKFWLESDIELLDGMVYDLGWGRDRSIGAIDVLWTVC